MVSCDICKSLLEPIFNTWLSGIDTPALAVINPTESTFVTSSYVNTPTTWKLPATVPTPATLRLSKFVWPSTSNSTKSPLPANVVAFTVVAFKVVKVWIPV